MSIIFQLNGLSLSVTNEDLPLKKGNCSNTSNLFITEVACKNLVKSDGEAELNKTDLAPRRVKKYAKRMPRSINPCQGMEMEETFIVSVGSKRRCSTNEMDLPPLKRRRTGKSTSSDYLLFSQEKKGASIKKLSLRNSADTILEIDTKKVDFFRQLPSLKSEILDTERISGCFAGFTTILDLGATRTKMSD